jgi:hypothetical protein
MAAGEIPGIPIPTTAQSDGVPGKMARAGIYLLPGGYSTKVLFPPAKTLYRPFYCSLG